MVFFVGKMANYLIEHAAVTPGSEDAVEAVISINVVLSSDLSSLATKSYTTNLKFIRQFQNMRSFSYAWAFEAFLSSVESFLPQIIGDDFSQL